MQPGHRPHYLDLHVILVVIRPLTRGERPDKRSKDSYTKCTDVDAPHVLLLSGILPSLVGAFIDSSRVMVVGFLKEPIDLVPDWEMYSSY
jgi:hypothetical protein